MKLGGLGEVGRGCGLEGEGEGLEWVIVEWMGKVRKEDEGCMRYCRRKE